MKVVDIDVKKIFPYANNPRHNEAAIAAVAASIKAFGWQQPIVVDKNSIVIVGHTRLLAAKSLGLKTVPVQVATNLSEAQVAAYRLADNRTGEISTWDEDKLFEELNSLQDEGFDLSGLGFTDEELGLVDKQSKQDLRYLEDFEVMPKPKAKWILISAPEDECAAILSAIKNLKTPGAKVEYSGEPNATAHP